MEIADKILIPKNKRKENSNYLDFIRAQKCLVSHQKNVVAHHVRMFDAESGMGGKPSDYKAVPLTNEHHTHGPFALHRIGEKEFWKKYQIDPYEKIIELLKLYLLTFYSLESDFETVEELEAFVESLRKDQQIDSLRKKRRESVKKSLNKKKRGMYQQLKKRVVTEKMELLKKRQRTYRKEIYQKQKEFLKRKKENEHPVNS